MVEVNENDQTSIIFGNGVLKNGNTLTATFLAIEQQGINLPGGEENLESEIDPLLGDAYGTLGEAPAHTTLSVEYRIGGGAGANVSANIINNISYSELLNEGSGITTVTVTNDSPAAGGSSAETIEEIRHRAIGNFSAQNRAVTREDYEARTLNMPARYGNIAKVYALRAGSIRTSE